MDPLEEAETRARKLATSKGSTEFPYLGCGGRAIITVFLEKLEALDRRLARIERKVDGTGGNVLDKEGA